jgi:hypothetical protein
VRSLGGGVFFRNFLFVAKVAIIHRKMQKTVAIIPKKKLAKKLAKNLAS